jgi:hypothetical protein
MITSVVLAQQGQGVGFEKRLPRLRGDCEAHQDLAGSGPIFPTEPDPDAMHGAGPFPQRAGGLNR